MWYITLVLVWALLGAILNPNHFLPYAAAASTLVTFVSAKIKQLKTLQSRSKEDLKEHIKKQAMGHMGNLMANMVKDTPLSGAAGAMQGGNVQDVMRRKLAAALYDAVMQVMPSALQGLEKADLEVLLQVFDGSDPEALQKFCRKADINEGLVKLAFAVCEQPLDEGKVIQAIEGFLLEHAPKLPKGVVMHCTKLQRNPVKKNIQEWWRSFLHQSLLFC